MSDHPTPPPFGAEITDAQIIEQRQTTDGILSVCENTDYRWLETEHHNTHSAMLRQHDWQPVLPYFSNLLASLLFIPNPDNILLLGLGGGELVRFFGHVMPTTKMTAVEIDPDVIELFELYFNPGRYQCKHILADANNWIGEQSISLQDLVFLDLYSHQGLPGFLFGENFYRQLTAIQSEHGVVAANFAVDSEQQAIKLVQLLRRVYSNNVLLQTVDNHRNLVVIAINSESPLQLNPEHLYQQAKDLQAISGINFKTLTEKLLTQNQAITHQTHSETKP